MLEMLYSFPMVGFVPQFLCLLQLFSNKNSVLYFIIRYNIFELEFVKFSIYFIEQAQQLFQPLGSVIYGGIK